jgi:large subunit ribosomal protein L19
MRSLDFIEQDLQRSDLPPFRVGDAVRVHVKVKEGEKERIQVFEGLVIRRRGAGAGETFTVRKIASGVGVERIFPVQSPLVTKVDIKSRGFVRRSRLYYLRDLTGKKARLHSKVRDLSDLISPDEANAETSADEDLIAPPVEEVAATETVVEAENKGALTGKARKRAKAQAKAERLKQEKAKAAEAKANAPAPEPVAEEAPAAEAAGEETGETEES